MAEQPTDAERAALQWLVGSGRTTVDRHTLFEFYESRGRAMGGMEIVSRRGAAGRMAERLCRKGYADDDGNITRAGRRAAQ